MIPSYGEEFFDRLFANEAIEVKVYCQERVRGLNLKAIHKKYPRNVKLIKYTPAKRDKIVYQFLPWNELLKAIM